MSDHARSREGVAPRVSGTVRIVGAGLLGASIGHALRARGVDVVLDDTSPSQLRLAIDYGAGRAAAADDAPSLIVVAVPPDVTADVIERELARFPDAVVTDVASVKLEPLHALRARGVDLTHYIGSHPMAGRERGGAISARADIFVGRPWVVCRDEETPASDLALVEALALELGATPIEMTPRKTTTSRSRWSRTFRSSSPSLLAARFVEAPDDSLRLAGQGVRDTTRIASSAPELGCRSSARMPSPSSTCSMISPRISPESPPRCAPRMLPARAARSPTRSAAATKGSRLPGKHGQNRRFEQLVVMVDDTPGQLGAPVRRAGELEVNVEDLRLEHSTGAPIRPREKIKVVRSAVRRAPEGLSERGWRIASTTTD